MADGGVCPVGATLTAALSQAPSAKPPAACGRRASFPLQLLSLSSLAIPSGVNGRGLMAAIDAYQQWRALQLRIMALLWHVRGERMMPKTRLPLVYACSGCSSVAQLANDLAVTLDRQGLAEMSCIAGVGGDVPALLRVAQSGRAILAVDGCALNCVRHCLARHQLQPAAHLELTALGFSKRAHGDCDLRDSLRLLTLVQTQVLPALARPAASA